MDIDFQSALSITITFYAVSYCDNFQKILLLVSGGWCGCNRYKHFDTASQWIDSKLYMLSEFASVFTAVTAKLFKW